MSKLHVLVAATLITPPIMIPLDQYRVLLGNFRLWIILVYPCRTCDRTLKTVSAIEKFIFVKNWFRRGAGLISGKEVFTALHMTSYSSDLSRLCVVSCDTSLLIIFWVCGEDVTGCACESVDGSTKTLINASVALPDLVTRYSWQRELRILS